MTHEEIQALVKDILDATLKERDEALAQQRADTPPEVKDAIEMATAARRQNAAPGNTAEERGLFIARCIRAVAACRGDVHRAAHMAKAKWGDEAVSKALAAGDADSGGMWIGPAWSADLIELLTARAVFRGAGPRVVPMPNGHITFPKIATGATAAYTGENTNITPSEATSAQVELVAKKLAALTPISNDLLRFDSVQADTIVRDDMIESLKRREDLAFLRGDGSSNTPKGLKTWCPSANVVAAQATPTLAKVTNDTRDIILRLRSGNVAMVKPHWFMSPRTELYLATVRDTNGNFVFRDEIVAGRYFGFPFSSTTQIPENLGTGEDSEIYLVDLGDMLLGDAMGIRVDASDVAAYYDGSAVAAAFSKDQTIIRAISEHDLAPRHDACIAMATGVTWGA